MATREQQLTESTGSAVIIREVKRALKFSMEMIKLSQQSI